MVFVDFSVAENMFQQTTLGIIYCIKNIFYSLAYYIIKDVTNHEIFVTNTINCIQVFCRRQTTLYTYEVPYY
jgi:hypothetical protein